MHKESLYLATITVFLTGISLSASVFADTTDTTDEIGIEIPISCTMSGTGTNTHYASIPNGIYSGSYTDPSTNTNYANGIGTTTIKAFCNDNQGFSIYAIGYTDNIEGKTTLSNEQLGSTYDIITGTATGPVGGNDVSNWSMKLSTITSPTPTYPILIQNSFDNYHEVPSDYTLVAKRESATDVGQNAVGSTLTTTYAAYISKTQPSGLYEGQVKYTMVHPYDTTAPVKKYMQNVSEWGGSIAPGETITVMDSRDSQEYTVARLADNKLWMTKNLRLDLSKANITAENTNNPTQAFLTAASTAASSDEWCTSTESTCTDQIKYNTSNIGNQTIDSDGHKYDEYGVYYNYYTATAGNGGSNVSNGTVAGDICPAGWHLPSGTNVSGAPSTWTGEYWGLISSIGGGIASDNSNYDDLIGPNGVARMKASPNNFVNSGYFVYYGYNEGAEGYYWTSLKASSDYPFYLSLKSNEVKDSITYPLFLGLTIRCVADPITHPLTVRYGEHVTSVSVDGVIVNNGSSVGLLENSVHTISATLEDGYLMESWSTSTGSITDTVSESTSLKMGVMPGTLSLSTESRFVYLDSNLHEINSCSSSFDSRKVYIARDIRDNEEYRFAKLADGNCWMLDNLRLDPTNPNTAANMNEQNTNAPAEAVYNYLHGGNSSGNTGWSENAVANVNIGFSSYVNPIINNANKGDIAINYGNGSGKIGVYYNYCAASIGTICSQTNALSIEYDICPYAWRIPSGAGGSQAADGDYGMLYYSYRNALPSQDDAFRSALSITLSGAMGNNNGYGVNSFSRIWSSIAVDTSNNSWYLYVDSSRVEPTGFNATREDGYSVRCILSSN